MTTPQTNPSFSKEAHTICTYHSEAKRLADIIYTWQPDSYGKLQVVYRNDKGQFVKEAA